MAIPLLLVLLGWPSAGWAHGRSTSYSTWLLDDTGATVSLTLQPLDVTALANAGFTDAARAAWDEAALPALLAYAQGRLRLDSDGAPCPSSDPTLGHAAAALVLQWRVECPPGAVRHLESRLFAEALPGHLHFARLRTTAGEVERVLDERQPATEVAAAGAEAWPAAALRHVRLGVTHILSGADHLLFVALLLIGTGSLRRLAWLVTGFTLGHSLTLAAVALAVVTPRAPAVEALIGASIGWVALDNTWSRERSRLLPLLTVAGFLGIGLAALAAAAPNARPILGMALFSACYFALTPGGTAAVGWRWMLAALFGLVHGFGFGAVLSDVGLPAGARAAALLGFNIGVELGQLAVIAALWPLISLLRRHRLGSPLTTLTSAAGLAAGTFWLVSRTFG